MKVKDLIEKLKEYPEDAVVQVLPEDEVEAGRIPGFTDLDGTMFYFYDFRDNPNVPKGDPLFGKMFLEIG